MTQSAQYFVEESAKADPTPPSGPSPERPEIGPSRLERLVRAFAWALHPPCESPELLLVTARAFKIRR